MVYNDGDQLVRWPGMYRYSYDGAGNLVQVKNDSQTQVLKSYTYTPAGLLATATFRDKDGNTRTLSNVWDADSNRVGMNANGTAYVFVYDTTAGIPAVVEESTSGSTVQYIREPGGSLIARLNATEGIRYYHFDELGSTRLLTNPNGDITDRYTYDAYGSLLSHDCYSGSINQPYQYVGSLGYYTHYMEPDFGLLQLGVRFYDAQVGRFTQRDPVPFERQSDYSYVFERPLTLRDATGRFPTLTLGASCKNQVSNIADLVAWVNAAMRKYLRLDNGGLAQVENCNKSIMIQCWMGFCNRQKGLCGQGNPLSSIVRASWDKNCPPPYCTILHEIVHSCGMLGHKDDAWGNVVIPECGRLSQLVKGDDEKRRD
jgi:RHS repeat-associated protein